ncbi:P-type DNA transfer ATPase VirB11 [Muricoccus pecuniae]|uniref:Type IV secretion system protein n=1 Tax=Muricoccus pecuniae TaxID=693023 RepID=A0A840Y810_9PROT|nr:P-type DNA transfer ATPase VirB11 [Roseomonas pecuniae]MBB5696050.1 type IV secretion system protein VirB11 [Roseomonas pecuniae]
MSRQMEALPLLQMALSLLDPLWADPEVEDVLINRPGEAFVRRRGEMTRHEVPLDFIDLEGIAILAGSLKRQNVGRSQPLLSCDLSGGMRMQAILPPCVNDGSVVLAIRRPKKVAPTLSELGEGGIFADVRPAARGLSETDRHLVHLYREAQEARRWREFLSATVQAKRTHVLCGLVGTGKTHTAMALAGEIPLSSRLVTIQDADEMSALPHPNRVDLFYSKGDQSEASVSANDLVEASLRLSMEWLILQELRGGEAFSFVRALRSGHPGITTCHAPSAAEAIPALALMVRQHPAAATVDLDTIGATLRGLVDVVVHMHRPGGRFEISEVWFRPAADGAER